MARRKEKKYHFIYKTVNLITNKFYMGMHSTHNLSDGYLGSGKIIKYSIKKYGKENHQLEILEFLPDRKELSERERELINEEVLKDPLCMNLMIGGGVVTEGHGKKLSDAGNERIKWLIENDEKYRIKISNISKINYEKNLKNTNWSNTSNRFKDKNHKEKTKEKIGNKNKISQLGNKNSQFGTCWITNNKDNKKIKKKELEIWINNGWIKGRILNGIQTGK